MERKIIFSQEVRALMFIEVTDVGTEVVPSFEVHVAYYKPAKPEPMLRESRQVCATNNEHAARGFAQGFFRGHREGRSA